MNRLILLSISIIVLSGCGGTSSGDLTGVLGRPEWYQDDPFGTIYIPAGSYNMGASDQDVPWAHTTRSKTVSIFAFYMDMTEISNNEYRQFVNWVRDSIARRKLGEEPPQDSDKEEWLIKWNDDEGQERSEEEWFLNWGTRIRWNDDRFKPLLADMYLPENQRYYTRKEIDTRELLFNYAWIDYKAAAQKGQIHYFDDPSNPEHRTLKTPKNPITQEPQGRDLDLGNRNKKGQNNAIRGHEDRSRFVIQEKIMVFPDTLCWVHDFVYSYNDPMTMMYFWHPAYDEYPVVGVTWQQAKAFSVWRSQLMNNWRLANGEYFVQDFRLPTEAEWEYAARGDLDLSPYPWGGPYVRNAHGCFLGNFKPMRGRYMEDGGFYTVKITSYHPNDYGLYCMAGNVAEWTSTAYDESMYEYSHDLNPEYVYDALDHDPPSMKRKVIRGGSWKDINYYMQTGTRCYEYQDTAKCYVGFRNVMSYLGRGGRDKDGDL